MAAMFDSGRGDLFWSTCVMCCAMCAAPVSRGELMDLKAVLMRNLERLSTICNQRRCMQAPTEADGYGVRRARQQQQQCMC